MRRWSLGTGSGRRSAESSESSFWVFRSFFLTLFLRVPSLFAFCLFVVALLCHFPPSPALTINKS